MSPRPYDLIIYGATGFTGRYVVERLAQTIIRYGLPTRWAVAVRNVDRMRECLREIAHRHVQHQNVRTSKLSSQTIDDICRRVPILKADVHKPDTMCDAFAQGKLVMNCIGPYSLLGEPVVKACIDTKTHCMDLSGEPLFLEHIQLQYHKPAAAARVYIVGSCGFDSIPSDIGTQYLKHRFGGHLNQVDHKLEIWYDSANNFSYATWISLIEGYKHLNELKSIRRKLYDTTDGDGGLYKPYQWQVKQQRKLLSRSSNGYIVPFPGADRSVVKRTQMHRYTEFGETPVQFEAYFCLHTFVELLASIVMNYNLTLFTKTNWGEQLLRRFGAYFSFGAFRPGVEPNRALLAKNRTRLTLIGRGWDASVPVSDRTLGRMTKQSAVVLNCGDGAYIDTATIAIQTALCLLERIDQREQQQQQDNISQQQMLLPSFGVVTPGSIIEPEHLIPRLVEEGIQIEFYDNYQE